MPDPLADSNDRDRKRVQPHVLRPLVLIVVCFVVGYVIYAESRSPGLVWWSAAALFYLGVLSLFAPLVWLYRDRVARAFRTLQERQAEQERHEDHRRWWEEWSRDASARYAEGSSVQRQEPGDDP